MRYKIKAATLLHKIILEGKKYIINICPRTFGVGMVKEHA